MFKNHLAVHCFRRNLQRCQQLGITGKCPYQRARGGIQLKASAISAWTKLAVKINDIVTDLAANAASALNQPSPFNNAAANTGTNGNDQGVFLSLGSTITCLLYTSRCV